MVGNIGRILTVDKRKCKDETSNFKIIFNIFLLKKVVMVSDSNKCKQITKEGMNI